MEASERLIEAYMRTVKHCLTAANIKCRGNKEIDLLTMDANGNKYHIESTVKTSHFGVLKNKSMKKTTGKADKRRTIEFFQEQKFNHPHVLEALKEWGFKKGGYKKVIVVMRSDKEAEEKAESEGIEVWYFPDLVADLFVAADRTEYLSGDERVIQLIIRAFKEREKDRHDTSPAL